MIQRLNGDQDEDPADVRRKFDDTLGVRDWRNPSGRGSPGPEREEGAPSWWYGDEDASGGFLQSMGVVLDV